MFAEILELFESAVSKHLAEEEEEPINGSLLLRNHGPNATFLVAEPAIGEGRAQPSFGGPVAHRRLILGDEL